MNKYYVLIVALAILFPVSLIAQSFFVRSPSIEASILPENGDEISGAKMYDNFFENITDIEEVVGYNVSGTKSTNLNFLKWDDNKYYTVRPEPVLLEGNQFDIRFRYASISSSNYSMDLDYPLDYYDVYLYAQIEGINYPSKMVCLQAFMTDKWVNISENLGYNYININGSFLERAFEFRIYGKVDTLERNLYIDRIRLVLAHKGTYKINLNHINVPDGNDWGNLGNLKGVTCTEVMYEGGDMDQTWNYPSTWYDEYSSSETNHCGRRKYSDGYVKIAQAYSINPEETGNIIWIKKGRIEYAGSYDTLNAYSNNYHQYLYDYSTGNWFTTYSTQNDYIEGGFWSYRIQDGIFLDYNVAGQAASNFINSNGIWGIRVYGSTYRHNDEYARVILNDDFAAYWLNVQGYGFSKHDYPIISIGTTVGDGDIITPISSFQVKADISTIYTGRTINKASYLFVKNDEESWNDYTWKSLTYNSGIEKWLSADLNAAHFTDGNYSIWVMANDTAGLSSCSKWDVQILQNRPQVVFNSPDPNIIPYESYPGKANYLVNVTINDQKEYDSYGVFLKIFNEKKENVSDWLSMNRVSPYKDDWTLIIDPCNYGLGLFYLTARACDEIGLGYGYSKIMFNNSRPQISFNTPTDLETIEEVLSYLVNVSISDLEGDSFDNVSLMVYNLTIEGELDAPQYNVWQNLTRQGATSFWIYDIVPFDFDNFEFYGIVVRTKDWYGYNNNSVKVYFYRADPKIAFLEEDDYIIYTEAANNGEYLLEIEVTQGGPAIANFTYTVTQGLFGTEYTSGLTLYTGASIYNLTIQPRDLPYQEGLILTVYINNVTGGKVKVGNKYINSRYYLENSLGKLNYVIDSEDSLMYINKDVETNTFVQGSYAINYNNEEVLAYNYHIELPSYVSDTVYSKDPNYQILRGAHKYKPVFDVSDVDDLYFQFYEKPVDYKDKLYFNMETPSLATGSDFEEPESGILDDGREYVKIGLELSSNFYFENVKCVYSPILTTIDFSEYEFTLYIVEEGEERESDIDIKFEGGTFDAVWTFYIDIIDANEHRSFVIYGVKAASQEINFGPIMYGAIVAGGVSVFWFGILRKPMLQKRAFKKKSWLYYAIGAGIAVGLFIATFLGTQGATLMTGLLF